MIDNEELHVEIEQAIQENEENFQFENPLGEEESPLNHPVKEKDIAEIENTDHNSAEKDFFENPINEEEDSFENMSFEKDEAPEQIISESFDPINPKQEEQEPLEIPTEQAGIMADSFMGMTNNFLSIGAGFFVKIKKKKDFYEFEDVIQVIDEFNEKNVKKVILDEEDKALLRPLLIQILKKKAQKLTPEQQLGAAVISILMKKIQLMAEIRAENQVLLDKISDMVKVGKAETERIQEEEIPEEESEINNIELKPAA